MRRPGRPRPGARYHRLARTDRTRWWRAIAGVSALVVFAIGFLLVAALLTWGVWEPRLDGPSPPSAFAQAWELGAQLLGLAALIPAAYLAAWLVDRRAPGTLSSVAGRVRWRWLGRCAAIAAGVYALYGGVALVADWPDPPSVGLVAAVLGVTVALVPLQAAAEEYVFRGYLAQAVGAFVRSPWPPAVALSVLFAFAHGTLADQGTWLFVDRFAFGMVAAWLTIRTGGLEAAIALHTIGNVLAMTSLAAYDELLEYLVEDEEERAAAWEVLLDVAVFSTAAALMARAGRHRVRARWEAPARTWLTHPEDPACAPTGTPGKLHTTPISAEATP